MTQSRNSTDPLTILLVFGQLTYKKPIRNLFSVKITSACALWSILLCLAVCCPVDAQSFDSPEFGTLTEFDKSITTYEKDPDAGAVMLFERGDYFYTTHKDRLYLVKSYHAKIKILKESGYAYGDIAIPLLVSSEAHEDIGEIEAITHFEGKKYKLSQEQIYPSNKQPGVLEVKFAFPQIKAGSILEYKYTVLSPFFSNLRGWDFQSTIPKLYSEFNANIPYTLKYNRTLIGDQELCLSESSFEECFLKLGDTYVLLCENLQYAMEDIPAFNTNERYMLGASNYVNRVEFELSKIIKSRKDQEFTTSWADVERQFRKDKDIGKQLRYKGHFGRKVPDHLLDEKDDMTRAKNIYNFIRDYYTWDGGFGIYGQSRIKEAFEEKKGNVAEINMSLINLLNSAGFEADLVMMSTRELGLPKKEYPTMSDFNYIIVKVKVEGREYLLDASSKNNPFGILPFRALNHYGRVMNFKEESYWYNIKPHRENDTHVRALLKMNPETLKTIGFMEINRTGYSAIELQDLKDHLSGEEYEDILDRILAQGVELTYYQEKNDQDGEAQVQERIQIEMEHTINGNRIYINPFLIRFFERNPFLANERKHPIDFGFPQEYKYQVNLEIPEGFEAFSIPKNSVIRLGDNLALLRFYTASNNKQVTMNFELLISKSYFDAADYEVLKELFREALVAQDNSIIVLEKKLAR